MVEMLYEECGFQLSDDDSASLIETSGLDLNCTRAMIYRDVATWNETYNLVIDIATVSLPACPLSPPPFILLCVYTMLLATQTPRL